jgi:hypothetical protein
MEQWKEISAAMKAKGHITFFDSAYQVRERFEHRENTVCVYTRSSEKIRERVQTHGEWTWITIAWRICSLPRSIV